MDIMELGTRIENKLKDNNLVGKKISCGYSYPSGERNVQFEYNKNHLNKDAITAIVESYAKLNHAKSGVRFFDSYFSFFVSCNTEI